MVSLSVHVVTDALQKQRDDIHFSDQSGYYTRRSGTIYNLEHVNKKH